MATPQTPAPTGPRHPIRGPLVQFDYTGGLSYAQIRELCKGHPDKVGIAINEFLRNPAVGRITVFGSSPEAKGNIWWAVAPAAAAQLVSGRSIVSFSELKQTAFDFTQWLNFYYGTGRILVHLLAEDVEFCVARMCDPSIFVEAFTPGYLRITSPVADPPIPLQHTWLNCLSQWVYKLAGIADTSEARILALRPRHQALIAIMKTPLDQRTAAQLSALDGLLMAAFLDIINVADAVICHIGAHTSTLGQAARRGADILICTYNNYTAATRSLVRNIEPGQARMIFKNAESLPNPEGPGE